MTLIFFHNDVYGLPSLLGMRNKKPADAIFRKDVRLKFL